MSFPNANYNFNVVNEANLNSLVSNALSVAGDLSVGGNLSVGGRINAGSFINRILTLVDAGGATAVAASPLRADQSGTIIVIPVLTIGTQTISLPPASAGLTYTFVKNSPAAGQIFQILCDTTNAEQIIGNVDNNGTNLAIAGIQINFLAAAILGDSVTLTAIAPFAAGAGGGDVWAITDCPGSSATAWS